MCGMSCLRPKVIRIAETGETYTGSPPNEFPNKDQAEIDYHVKMLIGIGYLETPIHANDSPVPLFFGLSWEGHEFLDNIRDPAIWQTTKAKASTLASVSIQILTAIAIAEVKRALGIP